MSKTQRQGFPQNRRKTDDGKNAQGIFVRTPPNQAQRGGGTSFGRGVQKSDGPRGLGGRPPSPTRCGPTPSAASPPPPPPPPASPGPRRRRCDPFRWRIIEGLPPTWSVPLGGGGWFPKQPEKVGWSIIHIEPHNLLPQAPPPK